MTARARLREAERQLSIVIDERGEAPSTADLRAIRHRLRRLNEGLED